MPLPSALRGECSGAFITRSRGTPIRAHARRALLLLAALPLLQGCVAYEIRDELRTANTSFGELKRSREQLEETNRQLTEVNRRLQESSDRLASVEQRLTKMESNLAYISSAIETVDRAVPIVKIPKPAPETSQPTQRNP